jgi:hypothetical protein
MAWPKGKTRPAGSGRQKGSRNKKNEAIESITGAILYDPAYQENLHKRAVLGELAPGLEAMLFYYQFGRPAEQARDDQAFMADLMTLVLKYAGSGDAQKELQAIIEAHTTSAASLRVVA